MKATAHHLQSLDAFRGLTIFSMIVVNNPGEWSSVFPQFEHSGWNGITFADLVFPCFVFILGFAMPFAFARRLEGGKPIPHLYRRIARRALALFALGVILNATAGFPPLSLLRIPGVLQRLALVYAGAAWVVLNTSVAGQAIAAGALCVIHWATLTLVPFGGYAAGTLTPEHNVSTYLDALLLGAHRIAPTDPEGVLGTLPAIGLALLGAVAGHWIRHTRGNVTRASTLTIAGALSIALGIGWSHALPFNKPLWTGSFTIATAGAAAFAFALIFIVVDHFHQRSWAQPLVWLGVNPLAIYFASELTGHLLDQGWIGSTGHRTSVKAMLFWGVLDPALGGRVGVRGLSLLFALAYATIWMGAAGLLYRRGLRIQV